MSGLRGSATPQSDTLDSRNSELVSASKGHPKSDQTNEDITTDRGSRRVMFQAATILTLTTITLGHSSATTRTSESNFRFQ